MRFKFDSEAGAKLEESWRPDDAEDAVLSACSSLVSIVKVRDSQMVQFSHFSAKESLTADRLATSTATNIRYFHAPLESAHTILVQACVAVLHRLDEKVDRKRLKGLPLAFYAGRYWANHARFKNVEFQVQDRIELLFDATKPHFVAWTWIYRGDGLSTTGLSEHLTPSAPPLHYAALCSLGWTTRQLVVTRRQDVDGGWNGTPMYGALVMGHLEVARFLLEHGANVNTKNRRGHTPLHDFSRLGNVEAMRLLLDFGADTNVRDSLGWSPLDEVALNGRHEATHILLQHSADANAKNYWGRSSLHYASKKGHVEVVRLLIKHGCTGLTYTHKIFAFTLHYTGRQSMQCSMLCGCYSSSERMCINGAV